MSPIKLVVIAVLLYIGYRLLISDWRGKKKKGSPADEGSDGPVADVLVEDPVCHKLVPRHQAIRLKVKGQENVMYFCSEECCNRFVNQQGEKE